ncbi:MAG: hypothetical protein UT84_C0001G0089 [Candidatus Curtissbacteria bacterium GW2011_GWA1_40_16]|uniref:Uncharacterized protein n=1 Tax=Candidatus Curtissbacteria bacterium GW2011_GWA1_40_16 TaxID=1618405 RepID=A0A0G0RFB0_9BACT|nr:MAG: hypothetical protein UT84_C0001G0089 [Candidatus Curtissbacteria bacterium GW2011_GWA1_40_16]
MSRLEKILITINSVIYLLLAVFSYAYVDLNLTLSQNPLLLHFVGAMQRLGYYHRPEATIIFIFIVLFAYSFFGVNLLLLQKKKIGKKFVLISTVFNTLVLVFAYPLLSYDIFNYIFDTKIIAYYHLNPYTHSALDFPSDTWIRFMRWTHRYSPYGPFWLTLSLFPYILGFGKFILTLFAFKIFIGTFHLLNTYIIYNILQRTKPSITLIGTATYSLNPLFLMEGVTNAHNDIVLATFLLMSVFFLVCRKTLHSFGSLVLGILVKYIPLLVLPWNILYFYNPKTFSISRLIALNLITMAIFTYLFSSFKISVPFVSSGATQIQFQPWYLFWTLPLVALIPGFWLILVSIALSVGASLRYLPYLYYGDWSHQGVTTFMTLVTVIPPALVITAAAFLKVTSYSRNHGK